MGLVRGYYISSILSSIIHPTNPLVAFSIMFHFIWILLCSVFYQIICCITLFYSFLIILYIIVSCFFLRFKNLLAQNYVINWLAV